MNRTEPGRASLIMIVLDKNDIGIVAVSVPWIKEGKPGYSLHQHGFSFRVGSLVMVYFMQTGGITTPTC